MYLQILRILVRHILINCVQFESASIKNFIVTSLDLRITFIRVDKFRTCIHKNVVISLDHRMTFIRLLWT